MDDESSVLGLPLRGPSDQWDTATWSDRLDELLFDGERRLDTIALGPDRVLVTTHRLLVFSPASDGENFRAIDRPNVAGVDVRHRTGENVLPMAGKLGLVGFVVLLIALAFDPGRLTGTAGSDPASATAGAADQAGLLYTLDGALLSVGVVLLAAALLLAGYYALARDPVIVVWIDGDEDVVLPVRRDPKAKLDTLRDALRPS